MADKTMHKETIHFNTGMPILNAHAAGIDIGDSKHDIAISNNKGQLVTREYSSFTEELESLVNWLQTEGITSVAMESTGVYWICLFIMLEEAGIEAYLVNAKHVKNVTGRKKDDTDAMWLQKLHSCGLLQNSFQPNADFRALRTYVRHRKKLVSIASDSVRRMQKAMELANIKLHLVISDILGKTGLAMVEAILSGVREPQELLKHKDRRIKASDEEILKALKGVWKDEYLFMLEQAYDQYNFHQEQLVRCDEKIESALVQIAAKKNGGELIEVKKKAKKK